MKIINKITIIEDHPMMIKGVKELINMYLSDTDFFEFKTPISFLKKLKTNTSDLIILDLKFKDCDVDGFYLLEELKKRDVKTPVLVYSSFDTYEYVAKSINLGAKAFVSKNNIEEELLEAIKSIKDKQIYIPDNLLKNFLLINKNIDLNIFSKRERDVLLLLEEGNKNIEIAKKLDISPNSVTTYKKRVKEKLSLMKFKKLQLL